MGTTSNIYGAVLPATTSGYLELKTQDEGFPRLEIEAAGYHAEFVGQKAYNGVEIGRAHV